MEISGVYPPRPSCILAVFPMILGSNSALSSSRKVRNVPPFVILY